MVVLFFWRSVRQSGDLPVDVPVAGAAVTRGGLGTAAGGGIVAGFRTAESGRTICGAFDDVALNITEPLEVILANDTEGFLSSGLCLRQVARSQVLQT